jgi:transposase
MTLVGVDLHTREQSVASLDTTTGEWQELRIRHDRDDVEQFYAALQPPVTVAIESTGYAMWFHALMDRLGHTLVVGDAAKIRASVVRKTKTDRRDARHILTLLTEGRFPAIWVPDPTTRDLRALITHRMRLVRLRTMVRNGVHAIALNYRLTLGPSLFTRRGLTALHGLPLPRHTAQRREESLELLTWLDTHIDGLDTQIAAAAAGDPEACRLMTHPGVGPLTALATILVLGPVHRFPSSKHVVSYAGLAPAIAFLGRQTPPRGDHETGQQAVAIRSRPGGPGGCASRCRPAAPLLSGAESPGQGAGEGRGGSGPPHPSVHHAARLHRLPRVSTARSSRGRCSLMSLRPRQPGRGLATRDVQCGVPVMRLVAKTEKVIGTPTRDDSRSSPTGPDIVRSACANG